MRLTDIKLAGFKSFPEPTHISVPGPLVGIVGPNGCGKSNVIDAVRWVLGESQAKHLRGETMQDVIFNGTNERKATSRASVELTFDNSLGRAPGQWSSYAEISVKRVLERNGESSYYINNTHVRRRDVTDIFMGTGLGPRAYAIIEQGMISRIIESKPEELRVFLEEAAGVSKYKERRRETELRLADARDNLARVEDIRLELAAQIVKLEAQAEAAARYQALQAELRTTQNLLWWIRKRDAGNARERAVRDVERVATELEAETARLRETEKRLEEARQGHYAASDAVHAAQGELYNANAEVARIENQLQYVRDSRRRLESQRAQLVEQLAQIESEQAASDRDMARWQVEAGQGRDRLAQCLAQTQRERADYPGAESEFNTLREGLNSAKQRLAQGEQGKSLAHAHRSHAERVLQTLGQRRQKLDEERGQLILPDGDLLARLAADLAAVRGKDSELQGALATEVELTERIGAELTERGAAADAAQAEVTKAEARIQALEKLQTPQSRDERVQGFLHAHGLAELPRLWRHLQVEAGWEDAIESVFGMRLNALRLDLNVAARLDPAPPPGVTFYAAEHVERRVQACELTPLRARIVRAELETEGVLTDLLAGVYCADTWQEALGLRSSLPPGSVVVSRQGHTVTRTSLSFFAPQAEMHGLLARAREIEALRLERIGLGRDLTEKQELLAQAEQWQRENRERLSTLQNELAECKARQHQLQMEHLQLAQQDRRVRERAAQIAGELETIVGEEASESLALSESMREFESLAAQVQALEQEVATSEVNLAAAEQRLQARRVALSTAEKAEQEARFVEQACREKIESIGVALAGLVRRLEELRLSGAGVADELARLNDAELAQELQQALALREQREKALASAREQMEGLLQSLHALEQDKLGAEQKLAPLRDKINDLRLKEQEARLNEESYAEQLRANGGDEAELAALVEKGMRASGLQNEIARINGDIETLGAVNLAALSELTAARERKQHLDTQSQDLNEAVATLEAAIKRIDRETRERLQETFDKVNTNFSAMFPSLFGGGQARIELTGEEILDAGVQVIAQPPGKRTSSIHLLSGGEKALTALSLVFSLFQLNPAPFCLLDEVDAPLDDVNTERYCDLVKRMSSGTQFLFISHNKITMEMASHLVGITMQEFGVSRVVAVDMEEALRMREAAVA